MFEYAHETRRQTKVIHNDYCPASAYYCAQSADPEADETKLRPLSQKQLIRFSYRGVSGYYARLMVREDGMVNAEQMMERQRILADFQEFALRSEELDKVLVKACRLVGQALGTDLAKVWEIVATKESSLLVMRANVGWLDSNVGTVHLTMDEHSSETYAIKKGLPVLVADIREEKRFAFPDSMKHAGVRSVMNVPIFLPGDKPYGLLQVDSRHVWYAQDDDIEFLRTYATILGSVIDRLHKLDALQQAAEKSQTLLHELQHRIKNNVAVIAGLVRIRMRSAQSTEVRDELGVICSRIDALRLVHEHVYAVHNADRLLFRPYIAQLLQGLLMLHQGFPILLEIQMDDLEIASDIAIPLGLIFNEFTTNSIKYAFEGNERPREGVIAVKGQELDGRLRIRISDNGTGLPVKTRGTHPESGTGLALIEGLARQIGATVEWTSEHGTALCLDLPHRE